MSNNTPHATPTIHTLEHFASKRKKKNVSQKKYTKHQQKAKQRTQVRNIQVALQEAEKGGSRPTGSKIPPTTNFKAASL